MEMPSTLSMSSGPQSWSSDLSDDSNIVGKRRFGCVHITCHPPSWCDILRKASIGPLYARLDTPADVVDVDWTIMRVRTRSRGESATAVRVCASTCTDSGLKGLGSWWIGRKESVLEGRKMLDKPERKSGWSAENAMSNSDDVSVPANVSMASYSANAHTLP